MSHNTWIKWVGFWENPLMTDDTSPINLDAFHFVYPPGYLEAVQNGTLEEWTRKYEAEIAERAAHELRMQSIADDVNGHLEAEAALREEYRRKREGQK